MQTNYFWVIFCIFTELIVAGAMKIFRRILFIILCIVLAIIAIGFFLPPKIRVERKMVISTSPRTLFSQVNTLKNWVKWSPWLQMDTTMQLIFSGPGSGVGATIHWTSNDKNVGNGSLAIISSVSPDSLEVIFDFAEKGKSTGRFIFQKENLNTNVIFSFDSDLGWNPISRWFGLFSDRLIGPDIEQGLFNLDQLVQDTKTIYGFDIAITEVPARVMISVRDTASPETITLKLSLMYNKIFLFFKNKGLSPIGNPIAIFHTYKNGNFDIEAGIPVASVTRVNGGLICSERAAQKTVMIKYTGSYQMISQAYVALQAYIQNNELQLDGPAWEEYIINPALEGDLTKRQTNIYYPIKEQFN
jgi:effector-binding domain-containing protein